MRWSKSVLVVLAVTYITTSCVSPLQEDKVFGCEYILHDAASKAFYCGLVGMVSKPVAVGFRWSPVHAV